MGTTWTKQQQQVIDSRRRNLLVSAAAGSGKTAVLVERIIQMVTDPEQPLDIDRLLVMTFTNAAAAEMRERISQAIDRLLLLDPENLHLQMQATLARHAQITTIDSFCLSLIRNHFDSLELDPSFRIGDEGELTLLRQDVMQEMLEDYYEAGSPDFEQFVGTFAQGKGDGGISDFIFQVYQFSQSNPWPEQWLNICMAELEISENESFEQLPWVDFLVRDVKRQVQELLLSLADAIEICENDEILAAYLPMLKHDQAQLQAILTADGYEALQAGLTAVIWDRMAAIRNKEVDAAAKEYVTDCRDRVKKAVKKIGELYCMGPVSQVIGDMAGTKEAVAVLITLAGEFARRYRQEKQDKNLVDFNDLEHEALRVLLTERDGEMVPTAVADELSGQYEEILVDEYQDSNMVQETLIKAISKERFGTPNVFMVGDVKQSIYKFRLARPELFLEKYGTYRTEEDLYQKIELHKNFRSRETVLHGINEVFYRIMTTNLGNIHYTEEAALHPGMDFAPVPEDLCGEAGGDIELLLMDTGKDALQLLDDDAADYTARELEARMIAARIHELTDAEQGQLVWDKNLGEHGGYRRAAYRDIAVLLRSTAGWSETFLAVFMTEGIPAYAESRMGYFNTLEVETMLSFLAVIDNPMQDIPLAAVLKSPICGLHDRDLAYLTAAYKKVPEPKADRGIYGAWQYALTGAAPEIPEQSKLYLALKRLDELVARLRTESTYRPIHELIYRVFQVTGYYDYVTAMPAGGTRRANLDMLVEKAAAYERTSYKGLFHFIRYIENLKKYNTDFGEAAIIGEDDNTVRIMSIHKSKGLEFPVVFLSGMGKTFNKRDLYSRLLIDSDLGIGTDYLDLEQRLKGSTLKKNVLRRRMELDNLGEELRVLYVGMTRAKEKLIMTGTDRSLEKKKGKFARIPLFDGQIPYTILTTAGSYLDWILMSIGSGVEELLVREIAPQTLVDTEVFRQMKQKTSKYELLQFDPEPVRDEAYGKMLKNIADYRYPWQDDIRLHTKMSVSELKKQEQLVDEEESVPFETWQPGAGGRSKEGGSARGSAYHRILQLLDFSRLDSRADVEAAIRRLLETQRFTREQNQLINPAVIEGFIQTELGQRMKLAEAEQRLYKERQFVMGIPAADLGQGSSEELVLLQGIIDAYMEETDGLTLVDYKTDRVASGGEEILIQRYRTQLEFYKRALEQITGKKVKQTLIYSIALQKEIAIEGK